MKFQVSENAFTRLTKLARAEQVRPLALRVSVDGGGCNGFMYKYEFTQVLTAEDIVIEQNNTKVVIDPVSMQFLEGCLLDFVEQLGSSYFAIKNPNATAKCGCGNSFSV